MDVTRRARADVTNLHRLCRVFLHEKMQFHLRKALKMKICLMNFIDVEDARSLKY